MVPTPPPGAHGISRHPRQWPKLFMMEPDRERRRTAGYVPRDITVPSKHTVRRGRVLGAHVSREVKSSGEIIAAISGRSRGARPDFRPHETGFMGDCLIHI